MLQYWEAQAKNDDPVASYELAKLLEQKQQQEEENRHGPADEATKKCAFCFDQRRLKLHLALRSVTWLRAHIY